MKIGSERPGGRSSCKRSVRYEYSVEWRLAGKEGEQCDSGRGPGVRSKRFGERQVLPL